jgi:hypothetical protein
VDILDDHVDRGDAGTALHRHRGVVAAADRDAAALAAAEALAEALDQLGL